MKKVIWLIVFWILASGHAAAEDLKFSLGASFTGSGIFSGPDVTQTGLPGYVGIAVQAEIWNLVAQQVGIRARIGTSWVEAGVQWHLDLSNQVNLVFGVGVAYFWSDTWALLGNAGLEYHPAWLHGTFLEPFTFFFEYGLSYSANTTANTSAALRSSLALGIIFFL
jgi:hypothetical protein